MYTLAAITALVAGASAAPANYNVLRRDAQPAYVSYNGDGSTGAGWPSSDKWADFDTMWTGNMQYISESCGQFSAPNNSPEESSQLKDAIQSVAKENNVDDRFVLAVVLQESKGCVRIWQTISPDGKVVNPGLMQDHNGDSFCNDGNGKPGANVLNPCPQDKITGMIEDGVKGTAGKSGGGDGLATLLNGKSDAQSVYVAARKYNSGTVVPNDLSAGGATASYASDIANRLAGVVFDTTLFVAGSSGTSSSAPASSGAPAPAASGSATSGAAGGSYTVKSKDTCYSIAQANGITVAALQAANPTLGSACIVQVGQTLSLGSGSGSAAAPASSAAPAATAASAPSASAAAPAASAATDASTPAASAAAPAASGSATSGAAGGSYTVKSNDTCYSIAQANGITVAALQAANPTLGSACIVQIGQTLTL